MKNIVQILKLPIAILTLCFTQSVTAQTIGRATLSAFGNSASVDGMFIQQTVGQPALVSHSLVSNEISINQGFQQPFIFNVSNIQHEILLYPNPNNGNFSFQLNEGTFSPYTYNLYDVTGKLILNGESILDNKVDIQINGVATGVYHLQILQGEVKSSLKVVIISNT